MYNDDDMLMLSGIQHFRFCPRQWALIHIDQQWEDNVLTMEGHIQHKRVDDPFYRQKCGDYISLRSVSIASHELGLYGVSDVIELHPTEGESNSIKHPKYPGLWLPYPVEYKHGRPKRNEVDAVQLAAQTMCIEEQYGISISYGAFFYAEIRQRVEIEIGEELREIVKECAKRMHEVFSSGCIPSAMQGKHCKKCSLSDVCLPHMSECTKVSYYLNTYLYEETT